MKVRHKHTGYTGIPLDRAIDGRILVCWDDPKALLNYRQHRHNLVFIVPYRAMRTLPLAQPPAIPANAPAREQPQAPVSAYDQAARLYRVLCEKHYPGTTVRPLPTLAGVIDQIDHITAQLVRPAT